MHSTNRLIALSCLVLVLLFMGLRLQASAPDREVEERLKAVQPQLGDIVFTRIQMPLFSSIADVSQSWTNHVGIIVDYKDGDWIVAESRVPFVSLTPLRSFIARSHQHAFSLRRLRQAPTPAQCVVMNEAARAQLGRRYGLGFDLDARTTFCSKFVHEVVDRATSQKLGEVQTFRTLLANNPKAHLGFWRLWYFGRIPWNRRTITPASELHSPLLQTVLDYKV